jgi:hypothetical protein
MLTDSEYGIGINAKATVLYQAFGRVIASRTGSETTYLLAVAIGARRSAADRCQRPI